MKISGFWENSLLGVLYVCSLSMINLYDYRIAAGIKSHGGLAQWRMYASLRRELYQYIIYIYTYKMYKMIYNTAPSCIVAVQYRH